jgi:hypothetical protein
MCLWSPSEYLVSTHLLSTVLSSHIRPLHPGNKWPTLDQVTNRWMRASPNHHFLHEPINTQSYWHKIHHCMFPFMYWHNTEIA